MNEEEFHDQWALSVDPKNIDIRSAWASTSCPETLWIESAIGDVSGKHILELGTGIGEGAVNLARRGAVVLATDISSEMLVLAEKVAEINGVQISSALVSAEDLSQFESESFDLVYGANVLHHVDTAKCIKEIHRVLKPGGTMAVWDPVKYNPIINVYRNLAHGVRTVDEHPLGRAELRLIGQQFPEVETKFFWLTATAVFLRYFLIDRVSPSEGRYWRMVIERKEEHERFLGVAHKLDRLIFRTIPFSKWLAWNIAVIARKS